MRKIFAVFGFLSTALIIAIAGFFAYPYLFPLRAESGDLIAFQTKYNGPEATTQAYILRGESPNTQLIGEMLLPIELSNGEIMGKYYQSETKTLYFSNENGFYKYDMDSGEVKTIQQGYAGFTFKNIGGTIWYNLDIGFEQEKGYSNQLCEYIIATSSNLCHTIDNMQIFDVVIDNANTYITGYSSDMANFNNMIESFAILDKDFQVIQNFVVNNEAETGWHPELFPDSQNSNNIVVNNSIAYYVYNKQDNSFNETKNENYQTHFSSSNNEYYIFGGSHDDYNKQDDCTFIEHDNMAVMNCIPGRLIVEPRFSGYQVNPYDNGLLIQTNDVIDNGYTEEYINIIDLNKLTEIKRFNSVENVDITKDVIYIE